ncbi:hypothetical protein, partial [Vibrio azureus]|uniref:hypothetical protein n=1 Tax=Vibrio azureus TaxID=512649 RepID=UPI001D0FBB6A
NIPIYGLLPIDKIPMPIKGTGCFHISGLRVKLSLLALMTLRAYSPYQVIGFSKPLGISDSLYAGLTCFSS